MNIDQMRLGRNVFGSSLNNGNILSTEAAMELINDWVTNPKLVLHMQQVAHLMKMYAKEKGYSELDQHRWYLAGLLHDADWEKWPETHCGKIVEELEIRKIDPEIIHAIASHGPKYFGVEPETEMDKMLYAFDELSGLTHAYSLMRPEGYKDMEVKGVKKRLKDKTFAAQVSREDIADACERANIQLDDLIEFVINHQIDACSFD